MTTNVYVDGFNLYYGAVKGTPFKIITGELKLRVGILNPHRKPSRALSRHASFIKQIRKGVLSVSQFPVQLQDGNGIFHKPATW